MEELRISAERSDVDIALVHRFLSEESAWAKGIPLATVQRAMEGSLNFCGFIGGSQVAYARVVSDFATFNSQKVGCT